jgi:hypothetical protein
LERRTQRCNLPASNRGELVAILVGLMLGRRVIARKLLDRRFRTSSQ